MKILLIAYEFPPIVSAQALRWFYLANELAEIGVHVDILTTRIHDQWNFRGRYHSNVRLFRCFPGLFIHCPEWLARNCSKGYFSDKRVDESLDQADNSAAILSRGYGILRDILNQVIFPDVRSEWFPFAWEMLDRLLRNCAYDVLISSHEPGIDILLGLSARNKYNIPLLVDLGDPLLAPYTPWWRKLLDRWLERVVVNRAEHLIVTTPNVITLLKNRHRVHNSRFSVVPQGFDLNRKWFPAGNRLQIDCIQVDPTQRLFQIVFTGNFYRQFRDPGEFFKALHKMKDIQLIIAGNVAPFLAEIKALGSKVMVLNRLNHELCLDLQRSATILLNIGNDQSYQIPGKLFEYFGACRPILHVSGPGVDPSVEILSTMKRGVVTANNCTDILMTLQSLYEFWEMGTLDEKFDLSVKRIENYSWASATKKIHEICKSLLQ